jgi:hypothetical protein
MELQTLEARRWSLEEFGSAELGHGSRLTRLLSMSSRLASQPAGLVTDVFRSSCELEGAYRWLENTDVRTEAVVEAMGRACARRSAEHEFVFVPVDGSSVTLVDAQRAKDFGSIGTASNGARGVKVMGAIAVSPEGVPLGVATLEWWTRSTTPREKKNANAARPTADKETQRWLDAVTHTCERFAADAAETRCWFQLDREADSWPLLHHLENTGHWFTVRSSRNRRLAGSTKDERRYLRDRLARTRALGEMLVEIPSGHGRDGRTARLIVRAATVDLELRDPWAKTCRPLRVQAVSVRERGPLRGGAKPLDWMLFTNRAVVTLDDAALVVHGYCQRWRIEEFHKTWKSGACNVEQSQLRATSHLTKWATLLAAVALRIERLKFLARTQADQLAAIELTPHEIRALVLWKRKTKKRTEPVPALQPSIGDAVRWIAEMGGYTGKSSGGPPGSVTIARGLHDLRQRAEALEELESSRDL